VNPSEQGAPAWTPPTGPDLSGAAAGFQNFFQSPCFLLIAAAVVLYLVTSNDSKEAEYEN